MCAAHLVPIKTKPISIANNAALLVQWISTHIYFVPNERASVAPMRPTIKAKP
jgi:hypothetical protein